MSTRSLIAQWNQLQRRLVGMSEQAEADGAAVWAPNTDICECPDVVVVKLELAGVERESIRIVLEEQLLIVEGIRRDPYARASAAGYSFHQLEIEFGPFRRAVPIPCRVDGAHGRAHFELGILRVELPKARGGGARRVEVSMEPAS